MFATVASVSIRSRTRASGIKTVSDIGWQAKKPHHDRLPFTPMGAKQWPIFQVPDHPVGHLMRHDFGQEGSSVVFEQRDIEAQPLAPEMRLPSTLATQVEPHLRRRQRGVNTTTQCQGLIDTHQHGLFQAFAVQCLQGSGINVRQHGNKFRHGHNRTQRDILEDARMPPHSQVVKGPQPALAFVFYVIAKRAPHV